MDNLAKAKKIYDSMINVLNKNDWHFEEDRDKMTIYSNYHGEDIPICFILRVMSDRQVLQFLTKMPFTISEEKRFDAALAVCVANNGLLNGSFDYDFASGDIYFRLTTSFVDCEIGEEFFIHMIAIALSTTDNYNDKFLMLSKGLLSLEDFIKSEQQE